MRIDPFHLIFNFIYENQLLPVCLNIFCCCLFFLFLLNKLFYRCCYIPNIWRVCVYVKFKFERIWPNFHASNFLFSVCESVQHQYTQNPQVRLNNGIPKKCVILSDLSEKNNSKKTKQKDKHNKFWFSLEVTILLCLISFANDSKPST